MYHPGYLDPREAGYIAENLGEEYIELYNKSTTAINVGGWQITKGVTYTIPTGVPATTTIAGGGYLVVAADAAAFHAKYPTATNYVGGWIGQLGNNGEEIELSDQYGNRVDSVTYASQGDWALRRIGDEIWATRPGGAAGSGPRRPTPARQSLELVNAAVSNNYGQNWAASSTEQGTPGAVNSRRDADSDTAPIVVDLAHLPLIPKSTEAVTVTAKIVDEATSGLAVTLSYRVDQPSGTPPLAFTVATMYDDGPARRARRPDGRRRRLLRRPPGAAPTTRSSSSTSAPATRPATSAPGPGRPTTRARRAPMPCTRWTTRPTPAISRSTASSCTQAEWAAWNTLMEFG